MKNELIHTQIITFDFTRDKRPVENRPPLNISIEDSLNAVLSGLTQSLLKSSGDERKEIERRIANIASILDRRHW